MMPILGSTVNATIDDDIATQQTSSSSTCGAIVTSPGVWYYTSGTGARLTVSTCHDDTDFETEITIYKGSCHDLQCVRDQTLTEVCDSRSTITWETTIDEYYYIHVHGYGMGQFQIQLSQEGFSCASAVNIDPEYPREGDPCCSSALSRDVRGNVHGSVPDGSSDHACRAGNEDGVGFGIGTDVTLHVYMSLGLWYVMQGDGTTISLTELCFSLTSRNVWISVFSGDC